ncbi:MAG: 16S rRNA (guanine(966)-N(2))-methyltransferase RsmD [Bryobacteraceae bacterium]
MRVIAGEFRSRKLKTLPGLDVRPTPDRLREALFNVLAPSIGGTVFLDAYAGTGAVGIEALSRGASRAIFLERSRAAANIIRDNLHSLQLAGRAEVAVGKVIQLLPRYTSDIVFLDPPYPLEKEYDAAFLVLGAAPPGLVIAQHATRTSLQPLYGQLERIRVLKQGDNSLSFYQPKRQSNTSLETR